MGELAQDVPIFESLKMEIPPLSSLQVESFSKRLAWDSSKHTLLGAKLVLRATQTFLSGAKIDLVVNGKERVTLNWNAFESNEKLKGMDITSSLLNGDNKFKLEYSLGFGALSSQSAIISASIVVRLEGVRVGDSKPVGTGGTSDDNLVKKVFGAVRDNAVLIIGSTVAAGIGVVLLRSGLGGLQLKTLNKFASRFR